MTIRPPNVLRSLVATVVVALGVTVVSFGAAPSAGACSCAASSDEEAMERADSVFSGTLVEVIGPPRGELGSSRDPERFVFDVEDVFKGEVTSTQTVVTPRSGASCGLELVGPGPFVVFAFDDSQLTSGAEEGELYSHLCSGTRALADGALSVDAVASPPETIDGETTTTSPSGESAASTTDDEDSAWWPVAVAVGMMVALLAASGWVLRHRRGRSARASS